MSKYALYIDICYKYDFQPYKYPFLSFDPSSASPEDTRLMYAMLEIDAILFDSTITRKWLEVALKKYPFNGRTPREHIVEYERAGVLEVRMYLTALRQYVLEQMFEGF